MVHAEVVPEARRGLRHRRVIVHPVGGAVRVVRVQHWGAQGGRVRAEAGRLRPHVPKVARPKVPHAAPDGAAEVVVAAAAREHRGHVGHEAVEAGAVVQRRGRRGLGLLGAGGVLQAGWRGGGAEEAGGVRDGDFQHRVLLRLHRSGCVLSARVVPPLPLPPEVPVVEHLLTVGIKSPVISFAFKNK